jgi:Cu(I)/Ag(I) efflux system membrane protein CusA/SilA
MLKKIIESSVKNRFLIIVFAIVLALGGIYAMFHIPLDAIPDLSDVQVIIFTKYAGQSPQVVEDQVTYPLSAAMLSVPKAKKVRGYSYFGFSLVYVVFKDGTDLYWARNRVMDHLNSASGDLPKNVKPTLGPDATGAGWVYQYTLDGGNKYSLQQLRSIQDWYLRYGLESVPGVAEVASIGGFEKQYQVVVDPNKLAAYGIPLSRVKMALRRSNSDVGGHLVDMGGTEFMVQGLGYIKNINDIENIPVATNGSGTPVLIRDIAHVQKGPAPRRGIAEWNGKGETVAGIVLMRRGKNALKTIQAVKKKLNTLKASLPQGITIHTAYDRSGLIYRALDFLQGKLLEECIIVALITMMFLFHFRSALVAIVSLPLGILIAFLAMYFQGINANIMSLSGIAIAIGVMVDGAIVMIENAHKHMERNRGKKEHWQIMIDAAKEVGPSLFFCLVIITVAFLPIFSLQGPSGRMFKPLAFTGSYSVAAAALLSLIVVPVLMGYFIRGRIPAENKNPINRFLSSMYRPVLNVAIRFRWATLIIVVAILAATFYPWKQLGSEFMPKLNEGTLLYMPVTDYPGISTSVARQLLQQTDKIIKSFPEVKSVLGKAGRGDTPTDNSPLSMFDTIIRLKPKSEWPEGMTLKKLKKKMDQALQFPGITNTWTMPIRMRTTMLLTGIKTNVGIRISGPNLQRLSDLGQKVASVLRSVPHTASANAGKTTGGHYLNYHIKRLAAARYGLTVNDVQDVIASAIGGMNVTHTIEGRERYPVNVRYPRNLRQNLKSLRRVLIATPSGAKIPISYVADLQVKKGPPMIKTKNAHYTTTVAINLRDTDAGSYIKQAKKTLKEKINLPPRYTLTWTGRYKNLQQARKKLMIFVPITLLIIFLLLYFNFKNVQECLIVLVSLPFAVAGSVWLIYLLGYNTSVAVLVGMIALAGVAAEIGIIMLVFLDQAYNDRLKSGRLCSLDDLKKAVMEGAVLRLRPVFMTVCAVTISLLPVLWGTGTGSAIMKRIAAPMVGGMISATILCLLVVPVIYYLWKSREVKKQGLLED